jgi:muconate cycloisomerase
MSSTIESVETIPLRIPLARKTGGASAKTSVDVVIVRIRSSDGVVGIGETQAWRRQGSAELLTNTVRVIDELFTPRLIGRSALHIDVIMKDLAHALHGSFYPQAAVGDALHDLVARIHGVSVCDLLGGRCRTIIPVGLAILQSGGFDAVWPVAEEALARGYRHLRLKIGGDPAVDVATFRAMRKAAGDDVILRADANGALRFDQALSLLQRLEEFQLEMVEQPVPLWDLDAMAALARAIRIPLSADESLSSEHSLMEIARRRAASMIQTKIGKNGGLFYCKRLWTIAQAAGIGSIPGNHPTTSVAAAAMAHLCAAWPWDAPVGEFSNGPTDVLADDIVREPIVFANGAVQLPGGPGLGVDLDDEKVKRYRVTL